MTNWNVPLLRSRVSVAVRANVSEPRPPGNGTRDPGMLSILLTNSGSFPDREQQSIELFGADRLRDVVVHSLFETSFSITL